MSRGLTCKEHDTESYKRKDKKMNNIPNWIKIAFTAIGGVAAYLWGPWDALMIALVCLVTLDYITGLIKGIVLKKLDSGIGFRGLMKKVVIFVLVALSTVVERVIPESNQAVRSAVILYYIANESLSIMENAGEMGIPMPNVLKKVITRLQGEGYGGNGEAQSGDANGTGE